MASSSYRAGAGRVEESATSDSEEEQLPVERGLRQGGRSPRRRVQQRPVALPRPSHSRSSPPLLPVPLRRPGPYPKPQLARRSHQPSASASAGGRRNAHSASHYSSLVLAAASQQHHHPATSEDEPDPDLDLDGADASTSAALFHDAHSSYGQRAPAHSQAPARMSMNSYSSSPDLAKVSKLANKCSVQQLRKILSQYEVKGMSKMRKETLVQNGMEVYRSLEDADRRQLVEALSDPTGKERAVSSTVPGNPAPRGSSRGLAAGPGAGQGRGKKRKAVDVWTKPRQPHRYGYFPEEDDEDEEEEEEDDEAGEDDTNTSDSRATSSRNGEPVGGPGSNNPGSSYDSEANDSTFVPSETSDDSSEHSAEIMPPSFLNSGNQQYLRQQHPHNSPRRPKATANVMSAPSSSSANPGSSNPHHPPQQQHQPSSRPRITLTLPKSVITGQQSQGHVRGSTSSAASPASATTNPMSLVSPASPSPSPAQPTSSGTASGNTAFVFSRGNAFPLNQPMRINTGTPPMSSGHSTIRPYVPRGNPTAAPPAVTAQQYWNVSGSNAPQAATEQQRSKRVPDPLSSSYAPMSPSSYGIGPPLGSNQRSYALPPANLPGPYTPSAQSAASSRSGSTRQYADYLDQFSQYLPDQPQAPAAASRVQSTGNTTSTPHLFGVPIMSMTDYAAVNLDNGQRMYPSSSNQQRAAAVANNADFDLSQYLSIPGSSAASPRTAPTGGMSAPQRPRYAAGYQSPLTRDPGRTVIQPATSAYPPPPVQSTRLVANPNQPGLNANSIMANNPFAGVFAATAAERSDRLEEKVITGPSGAPHELRFGVLKPSFQAKPFSMDNGGSHGKVIKPPVFHQTLADVTPPLSIRRDPSLTSRGVYREIITTFFFDHTKTVNNDQHMVLMRFCQEGLQRPYHETHPDNLKLMLNGKTLVEPSVVDFSNRMKKKKNTVYSQPIEVPLSMIAGQNVVLVRWTEDSGQNLGPGGQQLPDEPPKDYWLLVEYARRKTMEEILGLVQAQRVSLTDTVFKLYQTLSGSDDDIVTDSQKISLHCPASRLRLGLPVRGRHCDHVDCFDANSFLFMNKAQKARWTCPKCNKPVHFDEIVVDEFLQRLLDAFPNSESIEATLDKEQIVVREASKPAEHDSSEMGSASASSSGSRPSTANGASASSSSGGGSSSRSAAAKAAVEIITLD
ncbi:zinc finger MIZ domain-containing protein 1-like [Paramacrobiotus metropolitanus]|uniref:zinc finger MIZ domain-containing protein 1-like n=1 Tax=Paramacrobiotus metropolitanus TaxID=2943436 RepID=UPI00244633FA|nr:zinc finger MIZ domain-containing protein 1-like [Paramacrobiotus metropolitanus]